MANRFFIFFALLMLNTAVLAQSFFNPPKQSTTNATASRTVMSPADFNKEVSQITTQKQSAFKEQLNQQLSQVPSASSSTQKTNAAATAAPATPTMPPPSSAPVRKDVYTGFGGTSNGGSTTSTTQEQQPAAVPAKSGGGWNIRY